MESILILWRSSQGEATALQLLLTAPRNLCFPRTRLGEMLGRGHWWVLLTRVPSLSR